MKERPILFSTKMVQAILDGRKTMTRRIVKPQPDNDGLWDDDKFPRSINSTLKNWNGSTEDGESREWKCPYGQPGDRLFVKETHYRYGHWAKNGLTKTGKQKWVFVPIHSEVLYEDNKPSSFKKSRSKDSPELNFWYKRSSLFMSRYASRITLEIVNVRVERLQDISQDDARKEGVCCSMSPIGACYMDYQSNQYNAMTTPKHSFRSLWQSINGKDSWEKNPWVWVVKFKRVEP